VGVHLPSVKRSLGPPEATKLVNMDPEFSPRQYRNLIPYQNQSDTDRIINALREAGLKLGADELKE